MLRRNCMTLDAWSGHLTKIVCSCVIQSHHLNHLKHPKIKNIDQNLRWFGAQVLRYQGPRVQVLQAPKAVVHSPYTFSWLQKMVNGKNLRMWYQNYHFRYLNWRYLVPTVYKAYTFLAYVREYPQKIWPCMVQYLHFRILDFP